MNFKKLFYLLNNNKKNTAFLSALIFIMAIFDVLGVASIMPFLGVLIDPALIDTNKVFAALFEELKKFGMTTNNEFIIFLGLSFLSLFFIGLSLRIITLYFQAHFVLNIEHEVSMRLLKSYLSQDYSWFLNRHSTNLGKTILADVGVVIGFGVLPMIKIITQIPVVAGMILLLVIVNSAVAIYSGLLLTVTYGGLWLVVRSRVKKYGASYIESNQQRYTLISEIFAVIKDIKAGAWEKEFAKRFAVPSIWYARNYANATVIEQLPRYVVEGGVFGGALVIILFTISMEGSLKEAVPVLVVFALAGYRLIPAMQQIYAGFTQLRFIGPALDAVHEGLLRCNHSVLADQERGDFELKKSIVMSGIHYNYSADSRAILNNIEMEIPVGTKTAIYGVSGAGKSTLVDLLMCLLKPQSGRIYIDNNPIDDSNSARWKTSIGYVSQNIVLIDDSIKANIAFGLDESSVNMNDVIRAAKIANIHEYIDKKLPEKYLTKVGERGVRLSGGQRQRIGIARALYRKPKVLILDEATSALDSRNEELIVNSINRMDEKITVIVISHKIDTIKTCDRIYWLNDATLKYIGGVADFTANIHNLK